MAFYMASIKSVLGEASGTSFKSIIRQSDGGSMWTAGAIVTYIVDTNKVYAEEVQNGKTCLAPATFTPQKEGWYFVGWREDLAADATVLAEKTMDSEAIVLYAVFEQTITATYYDNSTEPATASKKRYYNNGNYSNPVFMLTQAAKTGWSAQGWATEPEGSSEIVYSNGAEIESTSDITLYGRYMQAVTVTYYDDSLTSKKETKERHYNSAGTYNNPKFVIYQTDKTGWDAIGWATGTGGEAAIVYGNGVEFERTSSVTLYGRYQQTITLSYSGNGATSGSVTAQTGIRSYNSAGVFVNPTFILAENGFARTNDTETYTFTGWDLGAVGTSIMLNASKTAKAQWKLSSIVVFTATLSGLPHSPAQSNRKMNDKYLSAAGGVIVRSGYNGTDDGWMDAYTLKEEAKKFKYAAVHIWSCADSGYGSVSCKIAEQLIYDDTNTWGIDITYGTQIKDILTSAYPTAGVYVKYDNGSDYYGYRSYVAAAISKIVLHN